MIFLLGCKTKNSKTSPSHEGEVFVSYKAVQVPGGWGYKIYVDTALYIDQPFIPNVSGKIPFKSENDAKKTAQFVIDKMKKTQQLPTLNTGELKNLGVLP